MAYKMVNSYHEDLNALQDYVYEKDLGFDMINTSVRGGDTSDELFHKETLLAKRRFEDVGGDPDDFIIMSWLDYPKTWLPEDEPNTFTNLIMDFVEPSADDIAD